MKQEAFVARYRAEWRALELWLDARGAARAKNRRDANRVELDDLDFAGRYRRVCQHLSIAERRGYSPAVIEQLEQLMRRGHDVLYRPPAPRWQRVLTFFTADFPRQVRKHRSYMAIAAVMFFAPLITMIVLLQYRPELVHSVFEQANISEFERMYDPAAERHALGRESGSNLQMFGHYIMNNVSIGFRTFATSLSTCMSEVMTLVA